MSVDHEIAEAIETILKDIKAFEFFYDMSDHVMYRKVATDIYNAAKFIRDNVEIDGFGED